MTERLVRSGLLLPAVLAQLVAALAVAVPGTAAPALAVCGLLLAAATVWLVRRRSDRRRVVLVAALVVAGAVLLSALLAEPRRHPPALPVDRPVSADIRVETVAQVTSNDRAGGLTGRSVLHGVLVAWRDRPDPRRVADAPVTVFLDGAVRVAAGTTLRMTVVLRRAPPTDTSAYLGSAFGSRRQITSPNPVQAAADALRQGFARRATRLAGDGGALLPGLAIGDTSAVGTDLNQAMRNASLSHLTAVSGANCAVVIAGVFALTGLAGVRRPLRLVLAGVALAGFVVLVTPQPSVVRAATMAAVVLACLATGRRAAGVPVLALAVIVLLTADPWLAWSAGFVLSVLATGGLLLLTRPIAAVLQRVLPARPAVLVAVPVAAQIACQPVLILLQPAVPVAGVAANLLAEPAAPVATVLGLLSCMIGPVASPLADGLAVLAWVPAAWIALVARVAGGLPQVPWIAGPIGAVLAAALVVLGVTAAFGAAPRRIRLTALVLLLGVGIAVVGGTAGSALSRVVTLPRDWEIAACDVGQGDGLVLNGGGGHYAVIDTGRHAPAITACLGRLGIGRIDLLVLTHWDADHVGAAAVLAGRVGTVFVGPTDRSAAVTVQSLLAKGGARVVQVHRGDSTRVGRLRLDVLWPTDPLNGVEPGNAASVTVLVHGRLTSIFTGDLGEDAQNALLAAGPLPRVDVVKVAHHGSSDQSPAFYATVKASLGIVSVGVDNDYGHPTARLLRILRSTGTAPVRTDQNGLVLVSAANGRITLWTDRPRTAAEWGTGEVGCQACQPEPRRPRAARRRSMSSPGTRRGRPPSCSSRDPKTCWPTGPRGASARRSPQPTPASKSAIWTRRRRRPAI